MNDNKIIAEFMGANPFRESVNEDVLSYEMYGVLECIEDGISEKHFFLPEEMRFHDSWDWLMPVIEEIDHTSYEPIESIEGALATRCLKDTYKAVAEYVKEYHNEYHKPNNKLIAEFMRVVFHDDDRYTNK